MKRSAASLLAMFALLGAVPYAGAVSRYGEVLCPQKGYECLEVLEGDTWTTLWEDDYQRDIVRRINRMNVRLRPGMILAVPKKLARISLMDVSPFPKKRDTDGEKLVVVDLSRLAWGAYNEDGKLVYWGPASGGKNWCPDVRSLCRSPDGDFSVLYKSGRKCRSSKFPVGRGGAPMPYCMFFRRGYALHGSPDVPGYNASHGCVRLFTEDALWLNGFFVETPSKKEGLQGTSILVMPYEDPIPLP